MQVRRARHPESPACETAPGSSWSPPSQRSTAHGSGRPRSRLSRRISSKNSRVRARAGRRLRQAHLHPAKWRDPVVTGSPIFPLQWQRNALSATSGTAARFAPAPTNHRFPVTGSGQRRTKSHCPEPGEAIPFFSNCRLAHSCLFRHNLFPTGRVAAHFDEQRTKVRIINIEVVVVRPGRLLCSRVNWNCLH